MHETIIAHNIVTEAKKHGDVEAIAVEVGELAHVPYPELIACLQKIVDWKIDATEKPSEVECSCGFQGHPDVLERGHDHFMIKCPECGTIPKVVSGTDVKLLNVVVK